jgi:hypothetical protein
VDGKHLVMCGRNVSTIQRGRLNLKVCFVLISFGVWCSNNYAYVACVIKIRVYADIHYVEVKKMSYFIW